MATPSSNPYAPRRSGASPTPSAAPEHVIGKFKRMDHIGKGSFAEVYRGIHIEKRQSVAIKSVNMNKLNKKLKDNLVSEIAILRSLHHPHIVSLIDCQEAPSRMHIIMEFCELGDLSAFIKKRADLVNHPQTQRMIEKYPNPAVGGLNEVIVRHFAKQMASALEFLRSKNYIHRDLKPQNLLLNPSSMFYSQSGTLERMPLPASANSLIPATGIESLPMLKIADFGFARILPTTSLAETLCGSPLYMAPEILRYEKYDAKADLWSVGTVLFEMMCARPPFRANNHVELLRKIEERKDHIRFPEGIVSSRAMKNLIRALLKRKPTERMSYESFFTDPVIREAIPDLVDEDLPESLQVSEPEPHMLPSKRVQNLPVEVMRRKSESPYARSPKDITGLGTTPPTRPSSRATPARPVSTSPQPVSARRASNPPIEPTQEYGQPRSMRRPVLTNAATAPGRTITLHDQAVAAGAVGHRRRFSRDEQTPSSPSLKEHFERERTPQKAEAIAMREAIERAEQDHALDEGFVFVEKRRVEVDAFTDEVAGLPQPQPGHMIIREAAMKRRSTTQGSPTSTTGAIVPSKAIHIQHTQAVVPQRVGSYERRRPYRPIESATSAITKAINMVNIRGLGLSPPVFKGLTPPQGQCLPSRRSSTPTAQSSALVVANRLPGVQDEDLVTIRKIEELAQMSHVVWGFAEIKYAQLMPLPPSEENIPMGPTGVARNPSNDITGDDEDDDDLITPSMKIIIAEEALALYVKTLAILHKAFNMAMDFWKQKCDTATNPVVSPRFGEVIDWLRKRFHDCLDKSEVVVLRIKEAQKLLDPSHPAHPSNHSSATLAAASSSTGTKHHSVFDGLHLTTGISSEKLLYERAVDMSRSAAIDELTKHDLAGCDTSYYTAAMMLQAILEEDDDVSPADGKGKQHPAADDVEACEDRAHVAKILEQMQARRRVLKRKIEDAKRGGKRGGVVATSVPASVGR